NTVGPRQRGRYGMVVPRFVEQAASGKPITVFGDGHQTRSFCDVRDTVVALDAVADKATSDGLVINVGNDREISMNALAALINDRAGGHSVIAHQPYREAYGEDFEDIRRRRPDLARLRSLTGFVHRYTLEQTVDDLLALRRTTEEETPDGHGAVVRSWPQHAA
ncbi:MAG TPA: nucleoside-diphosphate sugar epimerase, partial [Xanthomonadales bacterium]|nr:nucleoside-diphosphate sugar epimerase [Xanthomonadales bacterium]